MSLWLIQADVFRSLRSYRRSTYERQRHPGCPLLDVIPSITFLSSLPEANTFFDAVTGDYSIIEKFGGKCRASRPVKQSMGIGLHPHSGCQVLVQRSELKFKCTVLRIPR